MIRKIVSWATAMAAMCLCGPPVADAGEICTTKQHLFWVVDHNDRDGERGRWVRACDLLPGDNVLLVDGTRAILRSAEVQKEQRLETHRETHIAHVSHTTYNFEVAETHTYFVGNLGVWVHNHCPEGAPAGTLQLFRKQRPLYRGLHLGPSRAAVESMIQTILHEGLVCQPGEYVPRFIGGRYFGKPPRSWSDFPTRRELVEAIMDHTDSEGNKYMLSTSTRHAVAYEFATNLYSFGGEGEWSSVVKLRNPGTGIYREALDNPMMTPKLILKNTESEVVFIDRVPTEYVENVTIYEFAGGRWRRRDRWRNPHFNPQAPMMEAALPESP